MESDSDDDLAGYAPSGLSQSSNKLNSLPPSEKEMLTSVKEEEQLTTTHAENLRRGELRALMSRTLFCWKLIVDAILRFDFFR